MGKEAEMRKKLYTKKCATCKLIFRTDNSEQTVCETCQKKKKTKPEKKKAHPFTATRGISLLEITSALEHYNERRGTCYTYGQIVALLDGGDISVREFMKR